jgi:1-deoxyxylulose-5-phosphate synthase
MSWLAVQPEIATVIAGATSAEQVRQNSAAVEAWKLTETELAEIDELLS